MNSNSHHKDFRINFFQLLLVSSLLIAVTDADTDWLQNCSVCHCNWNSGKKTADCKNKSLATVPQDLSTELQVVDLSYNIIPELRRDQFQDANLQNLHKIYLRNCTLLELNKDAFKGLAILIELDLSHNLIRILHPGTFAGLIKIRNLIVNHNDIEVLPDNLFRDLRHLARVEFKQNRIKRIADDAFVNLPVLSAVHLESNALNVLRKDTFEQLPKLIHLSLGQNPWNCSCELQQFRDFAISRRLYTPPTSCQEPSNLRDKLWSEIPSENFACRPQILNPRSGSYLEATSENVTLICRISGAPKPDVFWIFNKRPINPNDQRLRVRNTFEQNRYDSTNILTSELTIAGIRLSDKGSYACVGQNLGGKDESAIHLVISADRFSGGGGIGSSVAGVIDGSSNVLLYICLIAIMFLVLLIVIVLVLCWYCRRIKHYSKDSTMSENGLISKGDRTQNGSVLEGSVIGDMQLKKSLLTEVNPVEKPPRRTEIESVDMDDGHEIKKTLLDESLYGTNDDETNSIALSDTTPRSRQTFVDDGYGTNLPPDLLSFPARVTQSPSLQSSMSNIPDNRIYGKSPLASPVYQHVINPNAIYATKTPSGFMTLQHPKSRNLAMMAASNRNQSPFQPAPVIYSPVIMKQGYMTIPRKPRVPSWAPSNSTQLSEFQSPITSPDPSDSGTATTTEFVEPVYDNLGLRTTAGGNSVLNLNKIGQTPVRYTMKDRPLPATPNSTSTPVKDHVISSGSSTVSPKIYEPIHELQSHLLSTTSETEPLYGTARNYSGVTIVPSGTLSKTDKITKIPPRPPPKPKKKMAVVTSTGQGSSTSQLFEDEGEDGTEV